MVKKDNCKEEEEEEEEEDLPLPTYKVYLCENEVIPLKVGGADPVFGGDYVSKFGNVLVDATVTPFTTKGMVFADA